ncbi:MAG: DUF2024 family protein [Pyrinomonadaceae bacterium]
MRVSVFDTYVTRTDGRLMHFDILVRDDEMDLEKVYGFGEKFLAEKGQTGQVITTKECRFCHIEEASPEIGRSINERGFHIIEMENCL